MKYIEHMDELTILHLSYAGDSIENDDVFTDYFRKRTINRLIDSEVPDSWLAYNPPVVDLQDVINHHLGQPLTRMVVDDLPVTYTKTGREIVYSEEPHAILLYESIYNNLYQQLDPQITTLERQGIPVYIVKNVSLENGRLTEDHYDDILNQVVNFHIENGSLY